MDRQEKIEQYLHGQMSPGETAAFENEVAADPALAQEVELQRLEQELLLQLEADALRAKVLELRVNETTQPETVVRQLYDRPALSWRWKAAAAAVFVVLLAAVWYLTTTYTPRELVAQGFDLAPAKHNRNLRGTNSGPVFGFEAVEILEKRDKRRANIAVQYFQGFATNDPEIQLLARYNYAHALLLAENFQQAAELFDTLERAAPNDLETHDAAQYYRALALIGAKDLARAQPLLKHIAGQPAHLYHTPALELIQKLKKLR